jgi:hypothetical protein
MAKDTMVELDLKKVVAPDFTASVRPGMPALTDATKRALATFGKPFGLELYRGGKATMPLKPLPLPAVAPAPIPAQPRVGFHPDDTTPIPRPSRYYGRRQNPINEHFRGERRKLESRPSPAPAAPPLAPGEADPSPGRIDKSQLAIPEPKRLRDKEHLKFVAAQPCLVCGRQPCDPHHLRFAQPRAIGMKVSDEFTVPLCRGHHRQLHQAGNELAWWQRLKIEPLAVAEKLWRETHPKSAAKNETPHSAAAASTPAKQ